MRAHYFSVVSGWRALKYHHHLREPLLSFIPVARSATPNQPPFKGETGAAHVYAMLEKQQHGVGRRRSTSESHRPRERGTKKINETLWWQSSSANTEPIMPPPNSVPEYTCMCAPAKFFFHLPPPPHENQHRRCVRSVISRSPYMRKADAGDAPQNYFSRARLHGCWATPSAPGRESEWCVARGEFIWERGDVSSKTEQKNGVHENWNQHYV